MKKYVIVGAIFIILLPLWIIGSVGRSAIMDSNGVKTNGAKFGINIGDTEEQTLSKLTATFGNAAISDRKSCMGNETKGKFLVSIDRSWRNGIVCAELDGGAVRSVIWRFDYLVS